MHNRFFVSLLLYFSCIAPSNADTADDLMKSSDAQIMSVTKNMADSVARSLPAQLDAETKMMSVAFVRDTKTFIYKYDATASLEPSLMVPYLSKNNCDNRILKALMYRGITFKHVYSTPSGEQSASITYKNCK